MLTVLPWFISFLSVNRQAFLPSKKTSMEKPSHVDSAMLVLDFTPPTVPASSPELLLNSDPLLAAMLPPSTLIEVVPLARSVALEMFGYGTGTGVGGVLHTSGTVAIEIPPLSPL